MNLSARVALGLLLLLVPSGFSQSATQKIPATFSFDQDREPIALLNGLWRFHPGDDPDGRLGWAKPGFDDRDWALIRSDKSWSSQGYDGMAGMAWYRVQVLIPKGFKDLSLYIPTVLTSYQVFADGKLIGGRGGMPPHEHAAHMVPAVYRLPLSSTDGARTLLIAVRVWHMPIWAMYRGGGFQGDIRIGESRLIDGRSESIDHERAWNAVSNICMILVQTLAGIAAVSFFIFRRQQREYLFFGMMALLRGAMDCFNLYAYFHMVGIRERDLIAFLIRAGLELAAIGFYFNLLRGKRNWLFWAAVGSVFALAMVPVVGWMQFSSVAFLTAVTTAQLILISLWVLDLLFRRAFQGLPDARLLLAPVLVQQLALVTYMAYSISERLSRRPVGDEWLVDTWQWPFPFSILDATDMLFLLGMMAILIYRFTRTSRQEERFAGEFEAARTVQQVLVPEETPAVTGFHIETVYKPANEVGGDFFQILPTSEGGVLICIGDVSGKGLPAAMMVSLIVGTMRTLAEMTSSPAQILAGLNRRLYGRGSGFTTCLALRVDIDGTFRVSNAGHIAPYCEGGELALENSLPLGLDADAFYAEATFRLEEGETLTLVTDGVVEARAKSGELFGFERTKALSLQTAQAIARAAQHFGQEDDITVLTVARIARLPEPEAVAALPPLSHASG